MVPSAPVVVEMFVVKLVALSAFQIVPKRVLQIVRGVVIQIVKMIVAVDVG